MHVSLVESVTPSRVIGIPWEKLIMTGETEFTTGKTNTSNAQEVEMATNEPPSDVTAYNDIEQICNLPRHLKQFIVDQNYSKYTPVDHAVWRYIMRQNYDYLKDHAHEAYFDGLSNTGISIDRIPSVEEMNEILSKIGWAAVTVDGFIPPAAFMEFQAYRVLVIAADMRQANHIEYTPAPDIVHEAAGHAPIIADHRYAEYLQLIGEIGAKAMSSRKDFALYEAIRHLSILKEAPDADQKETDEAEKLVDFRQQNLGKPSEMALLSRLHWWTVEYGLIGDIDNPKFYGAGLLSSIGESCNCLKDSVRKIPYNIDTADYAFDITTQQPQLFVTPDFDHLTDVLKQFAKGMAAFNGNLDGINKAIECINVATCQYSSGLQVTGVFSEVISDNDEPIYLKTSGPTSLAFDYKELEGHSRNYHKDGFGSPVGKLSQTGMPLEEMSQAELDGMDISVGKICSLRFESGLTVIGKLENIVMRNQRNILMTFTDCKVTHGDAILFDPSWGIYDMAVGASIVSVFGSAADKEAYEPVSLVPRERTIKVSYSDKTKQLHHLYQQVRDCRDGKCGMESLLTVWKEIDDDYPEEWLLPLEILELLRRDQADPPLQVRINEYLDNLAQTNKSLTKLIRDSLALLDKEV